MTTNSIQPLGGVLSPKDVESVLIALQDRRNIAIFGDTRHGKTTLLRSLLDCVDPRLTLRVRDIPTETLNARKHFPERNVLTLVETERNRGTFSDDVWKKLDGEMTVSVIEDAFTYPEDRLSIEQAKHIGFQLIVTVNSDLKTPSPDNVYDLAKEMLQTISDFVTIQCTYSSEDGFKATVIRN